MSLPDLPEPPINSTASPYRALARRVLLCQLRCQDCDCPALVACALEGRTETPRMLLSLPDVPPDILERIRAVTTQSRALSESEKSDTIKKIWQS